MSKKSKSKPKVYNPSAAITVNGNVKSSATSTKNGANVTYNMDPYEQAAYDYAGKSFYDNLGKINVFSNDTIKSLNDQVGAYLNQGLDVVNNTYTPMIRDMQNDIARRFGNTNNSMFMDNLNDIEAKRADAMSDLAENVMAKRNELINNELSNRYDYLNFLNDYQNQVYSNMLQTLALNNDFLNTNNSHLNGRNSSSNSSQSNPLGDILKVTSQVMGKFF